MTCKCGSDRIAHIRAKHSDAVSFRADHLRFVSEGSVPYADYANREGFIGGDYLKLTFCMDCGQIQNFKKIEDGDIIEYGE